MVERTGVRAGRPWPLAVMGAMLASLLVFLGAGQATAAAGGVHH